MGLVREGEIEPPAAALARSGPARRGGRGWRRRARRWEGLDMAASRKRSMRGPMCGVCVLRGVRGSVPGCVLRGVRGPEAVRGEKTEAEQEAPV